MLSLLQANRRFFEKRQGEPLVTDRAGLLTTCVDGHADPASM
jgi:hypothetical protein